MTWWVVQAKQEQTRQRRLDSLIAESAKGIKISETNRPKVARLRPGSNAKRR